jgi:hypothetical protein
MGPTPAGVGHGGGVSNGNAVTNGGWWVAGRTCEQFMPSSISDMPHVTDSDMRVGENVEAAGGEREKMRVARTRANNGTLKIFHLRQISVRGRNLAVSMERRYASQNGNGDGYRRFLPRRGFSPTHEHPQRISPFFPVSPTM